MQFKAYSSEVEVNGETVYAIVDGMGENKDIALRILADHGIENPMSGVWYKQQNWLDAFKEISEILGDDSLFAIGYKIPQNAKFPAEIDSIVKALAAINFAYHLNHRNGKIGCYKFQMLNERNVKMHCENPYPCAFDRGIITAMVKRFINSDEVTVTHDDKSPCRKNGAESCTYFVSW